MLIQATSDEYLAFVISADDEIEEFLAAFGMSASDTNSLINKTSLSLEPLSIAKLFAEYISTLQVDFPSTYEISSAARTIYHKSVGTARFTDAGQQLLKWLDVEYRLFKAIENNRYQPVISKSFASVDELIDLANTLLNRRKSRAGKSLEHHLAEMFSLKNVSFSSQALTEGRKKPDFIFPSEDAYHDSYFQSEKLTFLGAKTTCKDRWRQILNEADRIPYKYLFTLQQGISENQLTEMYEHNVTLVVPRPYIKSFPKPFQDKIMSLEGFIEMVKER